MLRDVLGDDEFVADVEKHLAERQIGKKLFGLRNSLGMSQKDIADEMGCSQSRISKLESSRDADMRLGDLFDYLRAMDMDATVVVHGKDRNLVDHVKYHAACIKRLCDDLAKVAIDDASISQGVAKFFNDAALNMIAMLQDSAKELPLSQTASPHLQTIVDDFGSVPA